MVRYLVSLCVLSALALNTAGAQSDIPRVRITLRGWLADLDVETNLVRSLSGDWLDLDAVLDIDKEVFPEARVRWQINARHALDVRLVHLSYDADEWVFRPFLFDDELAAAFHRLDGDISLTYGRIGWRWAFLARENSPFRLEGMLDVAGGEAEAEYKLFEVLEPFSPQEDDEVRVAGALPTLGLAATLAPGKWIEFTGEISGMTAGKYGYLIDYELLARITPWRWFGIEGGYRGLYIKGEDDDDEARFDFRGPFLSANINF